MKLGKVNSSELRRHLRQARHHTGHVARRVHHHALSSRRRLIVTLLLVAFLPIVLIQLLYPTTSLLPNVYVGAVDLSGLPKEEAAKKLDKAYSTAKVPVYFSDSDEVAVEPTLANLGFTVRNEKRVDAYSYPFYARLVPYSLFWHQALMGKGEPEVTKNDETLQVFVVNRFGEDCEFEPINGTISYSNKELVLVDAARGGSCDPDEMLSKLQGVTAKLTPDDVTINGTSVAPEVSTATAKVEYDRLVKQLGDGVMLKVEDKNQKIAKATVASWVEYSVVEGKLTLGLNPEKSKEWLLEKYGEKYTVAAGTTVMNILDYAESSTDEGTKGKSLNTSETSSEIVQSLLGKQEEAQLVVDVIEPKIEYKTSFSPSNSQLSGIMKTYAQSHNGTYGVKMVELSGARRNAEYNATKEFETASTYKLFVAYSVLLRIDRGEMSWTGSSASGQSVSTCFDKMIKLSDNECAVWFLLKIKGKNVTTDAQAIGATKTSFNNTAHIVSNAADEAHFLSLLFTGKLPIQPASKDRLIEAMKGNVYVKGIPSGIPNVTIADKVGFLDGLLHDAAIIYSPKGEYVLIVMTDNASWADIAELAKEIEAAR